MMMSKIVNLIHTIKLIYQEVVPYYLRENLFEKAAENQITEFENQIDEVLPADFKTFLLENEVRFNFQYNFSALSIEGIVRRWQSMAESLDKGVFNDGRVERHLKEGFGNWDSGRIEQVWWSKKWIPFAEDSCGNMYCIDLAPTSKGKKGQLLNMEVQDGQGIYLLEDFENLPDFLSKYLARLEKKDYDLEEWGEYEGKMQFYIALY